MESTITASSTKPQVIVGVDTHKYIHAAHAVDHLGRSLGATRIAANTRGYVALLSWARSLGRLQQVGIEGPGHYGAGLAHYLHAQGVRVTEVGRPKRQHRARDGKSDDADAAGAAAIVLAGEALGEPKSADGP
ncbi:IS110 family transposase, partial [Mycobacteroides abscessus]